MQELDSRAAQLAHRRKNLSELAELDKLAITRSEIDNRVRDAQILVDDLTLEQRKADADVEQVKARQVRDQGRMDAGQITNPKDLERMQHELVSLQRRISTLEDEELAIMEKLEEAQHELNRGREELSAIDTRLADLEAARDKAWTEIDAELATVTDERRVSITGLPEDLLALYERIRSAQGIGAAMLHQKRCGGCQLALNAAELQTIAQTPADEVIRCEECSRILVRTAESGI